MIAFWSTVVTIAVKKLPASVPVISAPPPSDARN